MYHVIPSIARLYKAATEKPRLWRPEAYHVTLGRSPRLSLHRVGKTRLA